ncbi:WD-REPEATS-REGION domain-containing protein [Mycena indigotica]|uniref:WD-REPEATS-REGION domain-containing protein n=1 Tax=Mycena indigotica TaxID=2126181 RepID=A0A8H6T0V1_9AGAR|nr:WD-REPEATS-REGION domain-containing protein [Mycena indigotica]KAF7309628.1 WD-REPEATS-REGION domain-containing protein [Mycena indigotica]
MNTISFQQPARRPSWISPITTPDGGRRPSWTPNPPSELFQRVEESDSMSESEGTTDSEPPSAPSSDSSNIFKKCMQIDMKMLVGDAVGNMSISPTKRDIVLAARRGLFIIDLSSPLSVPRFLPQGGTWDVADVQWNPHVSRAEYIVSTSSEKLLIWNLLVNSGPTSNIEHILRGHYRAITDINWHPQTSERDLVVSTGVDSWLWAWDLRAARHGRAVFGFSAFNAGGTQVKWNRQDPHMLASSHGGEVLIWDRRKGSLPVTRLHAHRSKIYGIDWSRTSRDELVTCALDGTIKLWDLAACQDSNTSCSCDPDCDSGSTPKPVQTIRTAHPVWRARHLPFGRGVLSLPQRGGTTLGMYALGADHLSSGPQPVLSHSRAGSWIGDQPVEVFEGHTDVVKDQDGTTFQLITWSKDRTLKFWPVDEEMMQKVGHIRSDTEEPSIVAEQDHKASFSFRNPPIPEASEDSVSSVSGGAVASMALLSAPIGARMILAGVRAGAAVVQLPDSVDARRHPRPPPELVPKQESSIPLLGYLALKKWWEVLPVNEVALGGAAGGSSGGLSEIERGDSLAVGRKRSDSRGARGDEGQSLQDELTSVINKLVSAKIKLEKHDLTKKRTCTLGLHGPWGESSSVFIRVTFTFPRDYPHGLHPRGTPTVELERNPLISLKNRAFILRRLRNIREQQRPCLESCLRFLSEGEMGALYTMESSSDEEGKQTSKSRNVTVSLMRSHKNLTEPRTSQGTFGPNGELVCFFRTPPRIVQHILRDPLITVSSSPAPTTSDLLPGHDSLEASSDQAQTRQSRSPALIADAVRRLTLAATDRIAKPLDPRQPPQGDHILRIMTNLLTFSHDPPRHRESETSRQRGEDAFLNGRLPNPPPLRRSTVFITGTSHISGADRKVASEYIFQDKTLAILCQRNAEVARVHGRSDHERIFKILQALFPAFGVYPGVTGANDLVIKMIHRLHEELCDLKDLQMLAMLSVVVLQGCKQVVPPIQSPPLHGTPTPRNGPVDYFNLTRSTSVGGPPSPSSPSWSRPPQPALSTSGSSRGSWSSLFNAGTMRQFVSGVQDSFMTPSELPSSKDSSRRHHWRDAHSGLVSPSTVSRSWNETTSPGIKQMAVSFSSAGHKRVPFVSPSSPCYSRVSGGGLRCSYARRRQVLFSSTLAFPDQKLTEFVNHIHLYADVLFCWKLHSKRLELLKSIELTVPAVDSQHDIGMSRIRCMIAIQPALEGIIRCCSVCNEALAADKNICPSCFRTSSMPHCTICRLPVKGTLPSSHLFFK